MPTFHEWLTRVLLLGESMQESSPALTNEDRPRVLVALREAYAQHALDIGGPTIPFDEDSGIWAATVLAWACWQLVGGATDEALSPDLKREPSSASDHLSADVTLRLLPAVHSRAKSLPEGDRLASSLEHVFRRWPLTGVLADLDGEPATSLEFDNHPGLQMHYAERQVERGRPGWLPLSGLGREWTERIYAERNKPMPDPRPMLLETPND